jgi:DsbC/DsbD-like thiol-disulfide interchange protein
MKRRLFLSLLPGVIWVPRLAFGAEPPWQARLLVGTAGPDGIDLGLSVELVDNWKTYWRVPGDGGIPPDIGFAPTSRNVAKLEVMYPVPQRYRDESGEAIAYKHSVVFPLRLTAIDANAPVVLDFTSFFGVCDEVCLPAKFETGLTINPGQNGDDRTTIAIWRGKVPEVAEASAAAVSEARIVGTGSSATVVLQLNRTVDDLFVESTTGAYFHQPIFDTTRTSASLAIGNLKDAQTLIGQSLTITSVANGMGLEQTLIVH